MHWLKKLDGMTLTHLLINVPGSVEGKMKVIFRGAHQPEMDKPIYLRSCYSFGSLVFLIPKVINSSLAMCNPNTPKNK